MTHTIETHKEYSKLENLGYFMRKGGVLPYLPLIAAIFLATKAPYSYTEAYQKGIAGIIENVITQPSGVITRLNETEGVNTDLSPYIQDGTEIRTTIYETPEGNWVQNLGTGISETWRTRKFEVERIEKILADSGNSNTFGRASQFELQPENLPSEGEIQSLIVSLKELIDSGSITGGIDIQGFSSPEGNLSEDLTANSGDSFDKNEDLASARANYIQERLLQEIPEIAPYLGEITAVVNILQEDDIEKLYTTFNFSSLDDIHSILRNMNRGEITLSTEQNEIISKIFMRGVRLDYSTITVVEEENNIDYSMKYINKPLNEGLMAFFVLVGLLMSGSLATTNAYRKIQNAYMKNPNSKKGKRAESFLGPDDVEKIDAFQEEVRTHEEMSPKLKGQT